MTPSERADRAKELLDNPIFKATFSELREKYVRQLETLAPEDIELQHETALCLQVLKSVRSQIEKTALGDQLDEYRKRNDNFVSRIKQRLTP